MEKESLKNFICITELLKLTDLGIPLEDITWSKMKMTSDFSICIRHTSNKISYSINDNRSENNCDLICLQDNSNEKINFHFKNDNEIDHLNYLRKNNSNLEKYNEELNQVVDKKSNSDSKNVNKWRIKVDNISTNENFKFKKNSLNSKSKNYIEKTCFLNGNSLSVFNSELSLNNKNYLNINNKTTKKMIKSNSFTSVINNYINNSSSTLKYNTDCNFYLEKSGSNSLTKTNSSELFDLNRIKKPYYSSVIFVINPYDARIQKFETNFTKFAELNQFRTFLALVIKNTLFVICIKTCKIFSYAHFDENIDFICWLTPIFIAIITTRTIYHWDLSSSNNVPNLVFYKSPKMFNCQVIKYEADESMKWFALSSLYLEQDKQSITGLVQIYNLKNNLNESSWTEDIIYNCFHQCIEAHCVCFAKIKFDENNLDSTTLIAIKKTSQNTIKIYIIELGPLKVQNNCLIARTEILRFSNNFQFKFDIPLHSVISYKLSLIFILSKYGFLIICDLQTGLQLIEQQLVCQDTIINVKLDIDNQSLICVARNGQVLLIEFDFQLLSKILMSDQKLEKIGRRISNFLYNLNDHVTRL